MRGGLRLDLAEPLHVRERAAPGGDIALDRRPEVAQAPSGRLAPERASVEVLAQAPEGSLLEGIRVAYAPLAENPLSLSPIHALSLPGGPWSPPPRRKSVQRTSSFRSNAKIGTCSSFARASTISRSISSSSSSSVEASSAIASTNSCPSCCALSTVTRVSRLARVQAIVVRPLSEPRSRLPRVRRRGPGARRSRT